jgi:phosphoribosylformylglycinamidine cyclo-ligase
MRKYGVEIILAGGETADIGDMVSTIVIDSTIFTRSLKSKIIDCSNIKPGNVIVGLSSFGQSKYENKYNSGISSNGFTAARHTLLSHDYVNKFPESFSSTLADDQIYQGKFGLLDKPNGMKQTVGEALLSPTRTYLPIIKDIQKMNLKSLSGIIQSSGGGQVKCKNFGNNLHYIKDNLFQAPEIFKLIQEEGDMTDKEMYLVFNMGQRLEIYLNASEVKAVIDISESYGVEAQIIGYVEENKNGNSVTIKAGNNIFEY